MGKIKGFASWAWNNLFLTAGILLLLVHARWFRLTPLMLNGHNDSDGALVFGFIILAIYLVLAVSFKFLKHKPAAKIITACLSIFLLYINVVHLIKYFPLLTDSIKCNESQYYITWGHPFGDYQWTNYTLAKWENIFTYETRFYGYTPSAGPFEMVCDGENKEMHILKIYPEDKMLYYTDGASPRGYHSYVSTKMKDKYYFLSEQCNGWKSYNCENTTYTLVHCNLEYKSCTLLPIQYTGPDDEFYELLAEEATEEVILYIYDDYANNDDKTMIFVYGEHPRCYVDGCEILETNSP